MSSGNNYSLSDMIIQQPRLVDPSLPCLPPSFSRSFMATSFSATPHVSLAGGRGSHTTEGRLQGTVLPHYFAGCCSVGAGNVEARACFITGAELESRLFSTLLDRRSTTDEAFGVLCMPPAALLRDCSDGLTFCLCSHSMLQEIFFFCIFVYFLMYKSYLLSESFCY